MRNYLGKIALWIPGLRHQILSYEALKQNAQLLQQIRDQLVRLHMVESMRAVEHEWSRNERFRDPQRLLGFYAQVNSQNGEDGMIAEIFRRIGTQSKKFVELGLEDGRESNTAFLLACGWSGFWIDNGTSMDRAIENRRDIDRSSLQTRTANITAENAVSLLQHLDVPTELDLLSIDVDQNTYYIWEALQEYYPRVVVVEYNAAVPSDIDWKVNYDRNRRWDGSQNYGASLKALELLGDRLGYKLVGCDFTGTNDFFVRDDAVGNHFASPFTAENHYEPPRQPLIHRRSHRQEILDRPEDQGASTTK